VENSHYRFIHVGSDPRSYDEFEAIRTEINKLTHPRQPTVNWSLIEINAITLFEKNGIDLLSACYFTLARVQQAGLAGFVEGIELAAALVYYQWDSMWPDQIPPRVDALDWLNTRTGSMIRQHEYQIEDLDLLRRASAALELISDKLQQVKLAKVPRIDNLYFYVQTKVDELEKSAVIQLTDNLPQDKTQMIFVADNHCPRNRPAKPEKPPQLQPKNQPPRVITTTKSDMSTVAPPTVKRWSSFILGVATASLVLGIIGYFYHQTQQEQLQISRMLTEPQLSEFINRPDKLLPVNVGNIPPNQLRQLSTPVLDNYQKQLETLKILSPLAPYYYGNHLVATSEKIWPDSEKQKSLAQAWREWLQPSSFPLSGINGYHDTERDLNALLDELDEAQRQNKFITIARLRTVVKNMKAIMAQSEPLEERLRKLEAQSKAGQRITPAEQKAFDAYFNEVLKRYYLISNAPQPEQPR
jgi:type VI secretion system protein VasL